MTTQDKAIPQGVTLREAQAALEKLLDCTLEEFGESYETVRNYLSQPPAPEQDSGELVASADCPLCGKDTPHGHGTEDIAEWLRIQARRFVGANADDLIRINTSEVHLIDSLRRQIQELEHRVESLTPETSYENYGKSDAELKALFATTKEEATHNGIEFLMHGKNMAFKIGNQMFAMAYEPDEPGDFEFMKGALLHALTTITPDVKTAVDRFLGWKLPADFAPDCGINFTPLRHPNGWPTGTNLFTADQARQMFEHVLSASTAAPEAAKPERCPDKNYSLGCSNRHQCWEPCGELGHSAEHARPAPKETQDAVNAALGVAAKPEPDKCCGGVVSALCPGCPHAMAKPEQQASQCKLGCVSECLARQHGNASECPALPWQPEQQAQAEPEVVAFIEHHKAGDNLSWDCPGGKYSELITLQSHREAIAKKDAALLACVEALETALMNDPENDDGYYQKYITQAQEALK